jgi:predicted N-acetyltransferase YhbS
MRDEVTPLTASDFGEAMALLNRAFGEGRCFHRMLPSVYQPTDEAMGQNLAIRRAGRIVAILGLFPITWQVGRAQLQVARIGGVAVEEAERGQGLMRRLMQAAQERIKDQACELAFLGGKRSLYAPYGFERAGTEQSFHVGQRDLGRLLGTDGAAGVILEPPEPRTIADLLALHEREELRCVRARSSFAACLNAWQHEPRVARSPDGDVVGYLTGNRADRRVTELVARDPTTALVMVQQWAEGADATVASSPLPTRLGAALSRVADRVEAAESGNWWVRDWPRVLGALLEVRHRASPLRPGRVVLGIQGEARSVELEVDPGGTRSAPTGASPGVTATPGEWLRFLTGPLPTPWDLDVGPAWLLAEWRPLPLWLSRQDHV